jgi:hypothetical protein
LQRFVVVVPERAAPIQQLLTTTAKQLRVMGVAVMQMSYAMLPITVAAEVVQAVM